jgi:hypothetical protein
VEQSRPRNSLRQRKPGRRNARNVRSDDSLVALYLWIRYALLRGRPWRSLSDVVFQHMESIGTRACTRSEIYDMARRNDLSVRGIDVTASSASCTIFRSHCVPSHMCSLRFLVTVGWVGWYMRIEMTK